MMWGDGSGMSAGGVVWLVVMIVVLVAIVAGIALLVRGYSGRGSGGDAGEASAAEGITPAGETPLQILEQRYARGEIKRRDFLKRKADLQA